MPYGVMNPYPFQYGDGPTPVEKNYRALRSAVGVGGAGPVGGLEDAWRICKARAITAAMQPVEAAVMQAFPYKMTDHLSLWEGHLGIAQADTEEERRAAVAAAILAKVSADIPTIRAELQSIDPNADVESVAYANCTIVQFGKAFGPRPGASGPAYGSGISSGISFNGWPNFSTDFILHVRYTLTGSQTQIPAASRFALSRYLNDVLPSWVDYVIYVGTGFYLDGGPDGTSRLDQTAFS